MDGSDIKDEGGDADEADSEVEETRGLIVKGNHTAPPGELELGDRGGNKPRPDKIGSAVGNVGVRAGSVAAEDIEKQPTSAQQAQADAEKAARAVSLYSVWPSKNIFFCRGLMITGGSDECCAPNFCIWGCIMVPSTLYFGWVFPHLLRHSCYALPLATLVVFVITVSALIATCCTDPGIIPRRSVILATGAQARLEASLGYDVLGNSPDGAEPQIPSELTRKGYRWCRTCHIIRPPRASHCPDCDNCVLRYDHHCPFVNNCVGQRNYHFFFGFVTSVLVLAMLVLPATFSFFAAIDLEASMRFMIKLSSAMWIVFYAVIAAGVLVVLTAFLSLLLWCYHVYLIASKKTTKEYRKSVPNATEEPTLCAARGPQLWDPWTQVDPRDLMMKPSPRWKSGRN